jgi:RNA polymerase sigma factor (sigma-70 family)
VDESHDIERLLASSAQARTDSPGGGESDLELVEGCRNGQPGAWEQLVRRHAGLIYAVTRRYGLTEDECADVFQSVCVELWEQLDSVRDASVLKRWLVVVAGRKSWQARRLRDRWVTGLEADGVDGRLGGTEVSTEELVLAHADAERLRGVLERLPSRDRELVWYLFFDPTCPTYEVIGQRLGVSPDTVGSLRTRCLRRLRWVLAEHVA